MTGFKATVCESKPVMGKLNYVQMTHSLISVDIFSELTISFNNWYEWKANFLTTYWHDWPMHTTQRKSTTCNCTIHHTNLHSHWKIILGFRWKEYIDSLLRERLIALRRLSNFNDMQLFSTKVEQFSCNTNLYIVSIIHKSRNNWDFNKQKTKIFSLIHN